MDFKNLNIMVGIAALFSTVSLTPYASQVEEHKQHSETILHEKPVTTITYNVLTPVNNIIPKNFKYFSEYEHFAHMIMSSPNLDKFLTDDIGNNFVVFMIPHHEAALISSLGVINYTQDPSVKLLAEQIIKAQKKEIIDMQTLLKSGDLRGNNNPEFKTTMKKIMDQMMTNMSMYQSKSNNPKAVTNSYLKNMIIHHRAAIEMAQAYIKFGKNAELLKICNDIISSQEKEIGEMNKILKNY